MRGYFPAKFYHTKPLKLFIQGRYVTYHLLEVHHIRSPGTMLVISIPPGIANTNKKSNKEPTEEFQRQSFLPQGAKKSIHTVSRKQRAFSQK